MALSPSTGLIRAIGVSNFEERHIRQLLEDPAITTPPVLNQVGSFLIATT